MSQEELKKQIMRRVYAIWVLKKVTSPTAMKLLILFGVTKQIFSMVSVSNVIKNSASIFNPVAVLTFLVHAFINTETSVQILIIFTLTLCFWLMNDILFKGTEGSPLYSQV